MRLLKIEISKLKKKLAHQEALRVSQSQVPRHAQSILNMDLMDPNDNEKLKEDVKALKMELNRYRDDHRMLLAKTE